MHRQRRTLIHSRPMSITRPALDMASSASSSNSSSNNTRQRTCWMSPSRAFNTYGPNPRAALALICQVPVSHTLSFTQMRLDRDTLLQWYKTSADQFEAIVHGFLVRVKGTPCSAYEAPRRTRFLTSYISLYLAAQTGAINTRLAAWWAARGSRPIATTSWDPLCATSTSSSESPVPSACRVVSCRVVSCRVVSCRVVSCRVMSCRVVSCRVVSRVVVCFLTAPLQARPQSPNRTRCI